MLFAALAALLAGAVSCKNNNKKGGVPAYTVVEAPQVNLDEFPVDEDGYVVLFDGTSTKGWRGYGKTELPGRWTLEDGCLKFNGTGTGEGQTGEGGDVISPTSSRTSPWKWNGRFPRAAIPVFSTWPRK